MKIEILNKYHLKPGEVLPYPTINIMRPFALGNPFPIVDDRDAVIDQFDIWLEDMMKAGDPTVLDAMETIATLAQQDTGVGLICCCKPKRCHGDVIKRFILNALNGREPWDHPGFARPRANFIRKAR